MVYVTHDQVEAMTMGDRIVVLRDGEVQQIDTPLGLYGRPANRFVAGFIAGEGTSESEGARHEAVARVAPQALPEPGEPIELAIDLGKLHFFDPETELALTETPVAA